MDSAERNNIVKPIHDHLSVSLFIFYLSLCSESKLLILLYERVRIVNSACSLFATLLTAVQCEFSVGELFLSTVTIIRIKRTRRRVQHVIHLRPSTVSVIYILSIASSFV